MFPHFRSHHQENTAYRSSLILIISYKLNSYNPHVINKLNHVKSPERNEHPGLPGLQQHRQEMRRDLWARGGPSAGRKFAGTLRYIGRLKLVQNGGKRLKLLQIENNHGKQLSLCGQTDLNRHFLLTEQC